MAIPTKEKIIDAYNLSASSFEEAYIKAIDGDLYGIMKELEHSATYIYQSIEWFIKNYLSSIFNDPALHQVQINIIEAPSFFKKLNLFVDNSNPRIETTDINITVIKELKQTVRNDPEHSGVTPHLKSLEKVIKETRKILTTYMNLSLNELKEIEEKPIPDIKPTNEWQTFLNQCNNFDEYSNYVLVTGHQKANENLKSLGLIQWNAVFDFDPSSNTNGLFKVISPELALSRVVNQITLGDNVSSLLSSSSCYWVFSNGIEGRSNTTFSTQKDWNRRYSPFINKFIERFQQDLPSKPLVVVIVWNSIDEVTEIVKLFYNNWVNEVKFVFAMPDTAHMKQLIEHYEGNEINISINEIAYGILRIRTFFSKLIDLEEYIIPHKDDFSTTIPKNDFIWIEEDFEVIHQNIAINILEESAPEDKIQFYKGGIIDWVGLHKHFDINRESTIQLKSKIERAIKDRTNQKITLYHYPGIGASTISRRIAWELHEQVPVVIFKKYRPSESINRLYKIFQLSRLNPLVIVDNANISMEQFERFFNETLTRTFPVVLLWVQRKTTAPKLTNNSMYVSDMLTDTESRTFASAYGDIVPEKKRQLIAIANSAEKKQRHPLFFGLTAFEEDFLGLKEFIAKAILTGTPELRKIIGFICLSGVYAQKSISSHLFTGLLKVPETSKILLENYLPQELLYLVVKEADLNWRPLHYLIAREYLLHLLSDGENTQLMNGNLAQFSVDFIEMIAERSFYPSQEEFEILDRLFIHRNTEDLNDNDKDSQFSKLIVEGFIEDISRLRVFVTLTEKFPKEPHFWSHLARFYNFKIENFEEALFAINKGIAIDIEDQGKDYTLYHVKGMIFKSQVSRLAQKNWGDKNISNEVVFEIEELLKQCDEQFTIARNYNNKSGYGYISHIDVITHYLDFKYTISKYADRATFMVNLSSFDMEHLDIAEDLLQELRTKRLYDADKFYITRCSNDIKKLCSDYSAIIQGWNNLLDPRKNNPKTVIRKLLVNAYVDKADGWDKLSKKDMDRIVSLMEENISADPNDSRSIYLWFNTARLSNSIPINIAIEKVAKWKIISNTIEACFYLMILHTIEAIKGNSKSKLRAEELQFEISEMARSYPNRAYCSEWLGIGNGLDKIISNSKATWSNGPNEKNFAKDRLEFVTGKVIDIKGPERGTIELTCGLKAFFTAAQVNKGQGVVKERDLNKDVKFYLGFSYDSLRAYEVEEVTKKLN